VERATEPGITRGPRARRVGFEYPATLPVVWTPRFPELSAAANGVSLLMPHVEPYVVRSVRAQLDGLAPQPRAEAEAFIGQELRHHAQHRRFNDLLIAQVPGLARLDGWMRRTYRWLSRRSPRFGLAFAAGSETVAFAIARWTESHVRRLFDGADAQVTTLFLWHLAEEVEHKSVAFDVYEASGGGRLRYLFAALCSVALLSWFTFLSVLVLLHHQRRLWQPVAWWRLLVWGISLAFEVLPDLFVSALPSHHPDDFVDPGLLTTWLAQYDPDRATMPLWWTGTDPGTAPTGSTPHAPPPDAA
jgi:uncharacterized protein